VADIQELAMNFVKRGILIFAALGIGSAWAAEESYGTARLLISNNPSENTKSIQWDAYDVPVQVEKNNEISEAVVELHGALLGQNTNLIFDDHNIPLTPSKDGASSNFAEKITLSGPVTVLSFYAVDPFGKAQKEKLVIVFPEWKKFSLAVAQDRVASHRFMTSVGLGVSYLDYRQADNIDLAEIGLTGKFNAVYILKPNEWELGANVFGTLLPYELSPGGRASARFYGINGRLGYRLPVNIPSTNLWVMAGWYMWGMLVGSDPVVPYGVASLGGPQLFMTARMTPAGKQARWVYLKFASVQNTEILSFTSRELAAGGGIELSTPGAGHPWSLTLDIADASFVVQSTSISLFSSSIGVGVGL
jgi:hypothetical protein